MSSPTNSDSDDDSIGLSSDALAALQSVLGVAGGSEAGPSDQDAFLAQLLHSRRMMEDSSDDDDDDEEEGEEDDNDNDMLPGESHADYYRRKFPERYTDSSSTSDNNNTAAVVQNNTSRDKNAKNVALITVEDEYVSALIISAFKETKKWDILTEKKKKLTSNSESDSKENNDYDLHWGEYEDIEWFSKGFESGKTIVSCYYNRKGLIRKGHLASILEKWQTKYKGSRQPIAPKSWVLRLPILSPSKQEGEVVENDENPNVVIPTNIQKILDDTIQNSNFPGFSTSSSSSPVKEIYILKPSVTNQANGIRLVSSNQELHNALYTADEVAKAGDFVLQTYIPPLLLDERKFHLRVFMLCIGNLTCYIHQDFLAIFSLEKYDQTSIENTRAHLTNIAHQEVLSEDDQHRCMRRFDECKEDLTLLTNIDDEKEAQERIQATKKRVYEITGELMQAVSSELTFTQKPNCFELFGLDFMIDPDWNVWLLEANAEPDLSKAGDRLQYVIDGMVKETLDLVVQNQGGGVKEGEEAKTNNFVKVYERKGRSF